MALVVDQRILWRPIEERLDGTGVEFVGKRSSCVDSCSDSEFQKETITLYRVRQYIRTTL